VSPAASLGTAARATHLLALNAERHAEVVNLVIPPGMKDARAGTRRL
jgi:hypothetical protein